jgi:hypothetical protein
MKWVLIVWTLWAVDGEVTIPVKKAEVYYPSEQACKEAMFAIERMYTEYTKDGYGYTIKCMERELWEKQQ